MKDLVTDMYHFFTFLQPFSVYFFQGNVYVKCPSVTTAVAAVNALHGRWFAGKVITAAYVPLANYHNLFPDSAYAQQILTTNKY